MRTACMYLCLLFFVNKISAQIGLLHSKTKIYLVRHAEKDTGKNPLLTEAGKKRAGDLLHALKNEKIQRIYTTPFRRTIMTGDSLRIQQQIDTAYYLADTTAESLLAAIRLKQDVGKTILVIGHSNTIPALVRHLGVIDFAIKEFPENEYNNLLLIEYKNGKVVLVRNTYGNVSATGSMVKPM